jgi:phosphatidylserine decarboxylase
LPLRLTRYGLRELVVGTAVCAAAAALLAQRFWPAVIVPAAAWGWLLAFFRDPDRAIPSGQGLLVSPADGHISDITPLGADSELARPGVSVGVFMSVLDVHVNRSPAAAEVVSLTHHGGAFLDARCPEARWKNESTTIRLSVRQGGQSYPLIVRQVAGMIARRIVTDVAAGQSLQRGQRIGMIKFGSRVELLVPQELAGRVCVRVGQKVRAGLTVLVEMPRQESDHG